MTLPFGFSQTQYHIVQNLIMQLQAVDGVLAIALGGSYARGTATPTSDIDIGLYYANVSPFAITDLQSIAERLNDKSDVTVHDFGAWGRWVNGGAWLTIQGQRVDWLYRSVDTLQHWITQSQQGIIELDYYQQPATGFYSYMYLAELSICQPLYDPQGILLALKHQVDYYPPALKAKIIREFTKLTDFTLYHADTAYQRGDIHSLVGCLHRVVLALVQILHAQHETYFISDKGAIEECQQFDNCPASFQDIITEALSNPLDNAPRKLRTILEAIT